MSRIDIRFVSGLCEFSATEYGVNGLDSWKAWFDFDKYSCHSDWHENNLISNAVLVWMLNVVVWRPKNLLFLFRIFPLPRLARSLPGCHGAGAGGCLNKKWGSHSQQTRVRSSFDHCPNIFIHGWPHLGKCGNKITFPSCFRGFPW